MKASTEGAGPLADKASRSVCAGVARPRVTSARGTIACWLPKPEPPKPAPPKPAPNPSTWYASTGPTVANGASKPAVGGPPATKPAPYTPARPEPKALPGAPWSPRSGEMAGSRHGRVPSAGRSTDTVCLNPIQVAPRLSSSRGLAARSGRVVAATSAGHTLGSTRSRSARAPARPSRRHPATVRRPSAPNPGSSAPRNAEVRPAAARCRAVNRSTSSVVRAPNRCSTSGSRPATSTASRYPLGSVVTPSTNGYGTFSAAPASGSTTSASS